MLFQQLEPIGRDVHAAVRRGQHGECGRVLGVAEGLRPGIDHERRRDGDCVRTVRRDREVMAAGRARCGQRSSEHATLHVRPQPHHVSVVH
jgi:hypothetical protein